MAKDAVDEAVHGLETLPGPPGPRLGHRERAAARRRGLRTRCGTSGTCSPSAAACTWCGSSTCCSATARSTEELLALVEERPELGEPLAGTEDYLRAEVVYAATHEGARHLDDVLTRRTRISIETFHRGTESAEEAAALMGGVLGWSDEQAEREVEHYLQRVAAERESQQMPDDQTADAARLGAPDVVPLA